MSDIISNNEPSAHVPTIETFETFDAKSDEPVTKPGGGIGGRLEEPENAQDEGLTRRGFVKVAIGGVGLAYAAAIGYPIYRYLNSPVEKSVEMAAVKEVALPNADKLPKGTALMFKFGVRPSLLIHHTDDTWIALSATCTHMGCTVAYNPATAQIECHCHGGVYDAKTGDNISGPPPRPLTKYNITRAEGSITVTRI